MSPQVDSRPNLEQICPASQYSAKAGPDGMGERMIDSMARITGNASFTELLHSSETHQSHEALFSSSCNTQGGLDKLENSARRATKRKERCDSPTESSPPSTMISPSSEGTCSSGDFEQTKSPRQINAFSPDTSDQVTKSKPDHENNGSSSSFIDSTTAIPSRLSEPVEGPPAVTNPQPVEDDPKYNIGEIKIYDQTQKAIPKLYEARWQVIRPDIFDRVHKMLRSRLLTMLKKGKAFPAIDLMSAGVTKACSMPTVVVLISRRDIKKMQHFLNTDSTVQNRCRPEDGTTVELLALACEGSSTLIGMPNDPHRNELDPQSEDLSDSDDSPGSASDSDSSSGLLPMIASSEVDPQSVSVVHDPTYIAGSMRHGMGIRLVTEDGSQYVRGTCGGLLHLEVPNQPPRHVGLMAAHLLEQLGQDFRQKDKMTTENPFMIGGMVHPESPGAIPRYDWALFDANRLGFEDDTTNQNSVEVVQESEFPDTATVVSVRTSRGELAGSLSSSSSGIMLNADQGFIQVKMIVMNKGSILTKGDSGAWVFRDERVYGYIIATNGNNHAYMVPLHTAIAEMRNTLGAVVVFLAISADPRPQGRTHEHVGQTERFDIFSDTEETLRLPFSSCRPYPRATSPTASSTATSVATLQEKFPQVDRSQLESQHRLAETYLEQRRVVEAIEILERAVETRKNILGPNHTATIAAKYKLAVVYTQNGQASEAIRILKHLLEEEVVATEKSDIGRLTYQHELGRAYLADGQAAEAIKLLEYVVAVKTSTLHTSDLHLLASQMVLAEAYLRANRASDAVNMYEHVVFVSSVPSSQHEQIRAASLPWLEMARRQSAGSDSVERLAGQQSKSAFLFVHPEKEGAPNWHDMGRGQIEFGTPQLESFASVLSLHCREDRPSSQNALENQQVLL